MTAALFDADAYMAAPTGLSERFLVNPFSVLDASSPTWQRHKRKWLGLGIESEEGRDAACFGDVNGYERRSVFDPVLCEVAYSWWCPPGGSVLDPFAGGSVRGVVAAATGRPYTGIELRREQVLANRDQDDRMRSRGVYGDDLAPSWVQGDSASMSLGAGFDFVFSCPPYGSLERYSKLPADLSNMTPEGFEFAYRKIIRKSVDALAPNRFACFVVGNYRDKRGNLVDLAGLTVDAFAEAGADWYNDGILRVLGATLGNRTANRVSGFDVTRKLGREHQYVSVFVKGDARAAVEACRRRGVTE